MKKILFFMFALIGTQIPAYAKPERMAIQSEDRQTKLNMAKNRIKGIHLQRVQDPEARKALQEIMTYLETVK